EWIGFLEDSIRLNKDIADIKLEITKAYPKDFRTLEKKFEPTGHILLTFTKPLEQPETKILFPAELNDNKIEQYSFTNDSVKIYIPGIGRDSTTIELNNGSEPRDAILIRTNKNAAVDREVKRVLSVTNDVDRVRHITLTSARPLANV